MSRWAGDTQPERTALAWTRTTLALAGAGLLCVRLAPTSTGAVLSAAVVCGATALLVRHLHLPERSCERSVGGYRADPTAILLATMATILVGTVGLIFALS